MTGKQQANHKKWYSYHSSNNNLAASTAQGILFTSLMTVWPGTQAVPVSPQPQQRKVVHEMNAVAPIKDRSCAWT